MSVMKAIVLLQCVGLARSIAEPATRRANNEDHKTLVIEANGNAQEDKEATRPTRGSRKLSRANNEGLEAFVIESNGDAHEDLHSVIKESAEGDDDDELQYLQEEEATTMNAAGNQEITRASKKAQRREGDKRWFWTDSRRRTCTWTQRLMLEAVEVAADLKCEEGTRAELDNPEFQSRLCDCNTVKELWCGTQVHGYNGCRYCLYDKLTGLGQYKGCVNAYGEHYSSEDKCFHPVRDRNTECGQQVYGCTHHAATGNTPRDQCIDIMMLVTATFNPNVNELPAICRSWTQGLQHELTNGYKTAMCIEQHNEIIYEVGRFLGFVPDDRVVHYSLADVQSNNDSMSRTLSAMLDRLRVEADSWDEKDQLASSSASELADRSQTSEEDWVAKAQRSLDRSAMEKCT